MSLAPGQSVGPYEIVCSLGEGGMGQVYRARDRKLDRDVALKILPDLFATDPERVLRFTREAKTLAALNHPNIASIYGIEGDALIMELVEGDDLSAHVSRGPIATNEALAIARQIVDALEAAHDAGIIHRDLKPANIKVRDDGTVKVLDFGLARSMDTGSGIHDVAHSPTFTARGTALGMIVGTAAYMSPEQARGRAVDKRTDVWAFGCVLYEMLSGVKPFGGDDATEIISAVVKSEPDWTALPAAVPPHIRTIVSRCLVKERKARIPDLSVVRYMLDETVSPLGPSKGSPAAARRAPRAWQAATAILALIALAAGMAWYRGSTPTTAVSRFAISAPENHTFTSGPRPGATVPVISPNGRTIAFTAQDAAGKRLLWVRDLDALTARPLPGTEGAAYPFWSPDSRHLGYSVFEKLMKVTVAGGVPTTLCALNRGITSRGGAWSADGVIIFNNGPAALYRVASAGGEATVMGQLGDVQTGQQWPAFLPDGRHFLYHASEKQGKASLNLGSLDNSTTTRLLSASTGARFDPQSEHLLFVREGTLLAQRFNLKTLALVGDAFPIAEQVEAAAVDGVVAFSVSDNGGLAYGIGVPAGAGQQLTWLSRQGNVIGTIGSPAQFRHLSLSPDETEIAAHRPEGEGGDIWVTGATRGTFSRFTLDGTQDNASPEWSSDGRRIAFSSVRDGKAGIYVKASNGAGQEERLFETTTPDPVAVLGWARGDRSILFSTSGPKTGRDLWLLSIVGERKAVPLLQTAFSEWGGRISPDGQWLAYVSTQTGRQEVHLRAFDGSRNWTISSDGGNSPRWRGDSRELFYTSAGKMMAIDVGPKGPGIPAALFSFINVIPGDVNFAVSRDGQRFLTPRRGSQAGPAAQAPIVVVFNWLAGAPR